MEDESEKTLLTEWMFEKTKKNEKMHKNFKKYLKKQIKCDKI